MSEVVDVLTEVGRGLCAVRDGDDPAGVYIWLAPLVTKLHDDVQRRADREMRSWQYEREAYQKRCADLEMRSWQYEREPGPCGDILATNLFTVRCSLKAGHSGDHERGQHGGEYATWKHEDASTDCQHRTWGAWQELGNGKMRKCAACPLQEVRYVPREGGTPA